MHQTLLLLRHAKAVPWHPGIDDFERSLADRGQAHMLRLAAWLSANLPPPAMSLCSPSARTRETLDPLVDQWPVAPQSISFQNSLYHASSGSLHNLAQEAFTQSDSLLMVGHNPGFESMAFHFMPAGLYREIHKMATGTLAVFEFPEGYALDAPEVELSHWVTRKNLPTGD